MLISLPSCQCQHNFLHNEILCYLPFVYTFMPLVFFVSVLGEVSINLRLAKNYVGWDKSCFSQEVFFFVRCWSVANDLQDRSTHTHSLSSLCWTPLGTWAPIPPSLLFHLTPQVFLEISFIFLWTPCFYCLLVLLLSTLAIPSQSLLQGLLLYLLWGLAMVSLG